MRSFFFEILDGGFSESVDRRELTHGLLNFCTQVWLWAGFAGRVVMMTRAGDSVVVNLMVSQDAVDR